MTIDLVMHRYFVYALASDAAPEDYKYFGMSGISPKRRLSQHKSRARAGLKAPVYLWMREQLSKGADVFLVVISGGLSCIDARRLERHLIRSRDNVNVCGKRKFL